MITKKEQDEWYRNLPPDHPSYPARYRLSQRGVLLCFTCGYKIGVSYIQSSKPPGEDRCVRCERPDLIQQEIKDLLKDWEDTHYLTPSGSVFNYNISVHKDTDEPCAKNPCFPARRLQDLGETIGGAL